MKKLCPFLLVLVMLISCFSFVGVSAMDTEPEVGEVLYHQNFGAVKNFGDSGIRIGTASSENALVTCPNESLEVETYDSGRVYILLPDAEKGSDGSFTIEFTFRFTEIHSDNGFIASILTSRGSEPSNITSVVIRADGTVDNFDEPDEVLKRAVNGGEVIGVKIPVRSWVVNEIIFTYGGTEYTLERNNVLLIDDGSIGFTVRNANAAVDEVYVVYGTDYGEKLGYYADNSYATDDSPMRLPDEAADGEGSPATGDCAVALAAVAALGFIGAAGGIRLGKKRFVK